MRGLSFPLLAQEFNSWASAAFWASAIGLRRRHLFAIRGLSNKQR